MKTKKSSILALMIVLLTSMPAWAVDTTKTYSSGILVLAFLGFCALIVVVQLIPSLMLLFSWIKASLKGSEKEEKTHPQAS